jgi:hypothetical protein
MTSMPDDVRVYAETAEAAAAVEQATVSEEPRSWQDRFLDLVRDQSSGVVLVDGSISLQHLQALCHAPDRAGIDCLTARYRLSPPMLGNLLAGFVADLARLRADATTQSVGDLQPPVSERSRWPSLINDPRVERLAGMLGLPDTTQGETVPGTFVNDLFELFHDDTFSGWRTVLFAETVDDREADWGWFTNLSLLAELPPALLLVVSGAPERIPPDAPVARLQVDPAETTLAYTYQDAPLAGDQPADVDTLDRYRYANGLARLVLLDETGPMTIGVHAPWGRGKSTFMRFVHWELLRLSADRQHPAQQRFADAAVAYADPAKRAAAQRERDAAIRELERAAHHNVVPVWFNAWQYDGAKEIWAGLTHQIVERMEGALPWPKRLWRRARYAAANRGVGFWLGVVAPALVAVLLTVLALLLLPETVTGQLTGRLPGWADWLGTLAPGGSVLAMGAFLVWRLSRVVLPVSERIFEYVQRPEYAEHMGYQNQVRRDIEFAYAGLTHDGRRPRIVVFIDDLDRCSDEKVLETLQAINLLLTASGFYVFLGIDTHMITQAIVRQAELAPQDHERAESYLRKIVQLSFRLAEPTADQRLGVVQEFFSERSRAEYATLLAASKEERTAGPRRPAAVPYDAPENPMGWTLAGVHTPPVYEVAQVTDTEHELLAFDRLREHLPENPRELKRLVNIHRLVKILVQRPDAPPTKADQQLLVAWLVFCFIYPDKIQIALADAKAAPPATVQPVTELDQLCAKLDADDPLHLTAGDLVPGRPLYEAAAITSLFHEPAIGAG